MDIPPEAVQAQNPPRLVRRWVWIFVCVVTCLWTLGACALMWGNRTYYKDWTAPSVWYGSKRRYEARTEEQREAWRSQPRWNAAVMRRARKDIFDGLHEEFTLGMILVAERKDESFKSSGMSSSGGSIWTFEEHFALPGQPETRRTGEVTMHVIRVGEVEYPMSRGRLVLIDSFGNVSQHRFESSAQNESQLDADVRIFLAGLAGP
ncbi:MAG: hypothetical protein H6839_04640 [Planctomycetes bacterium]|nr:hypothetical protein [Planctomycetota bacterium]